MQVCRKKLSFMVIDFYVVTSHHPPAALGINTSVNTERSDKETMEFKN